MIKRRITKEISIGNVKVGGGNPISVQSMCNTDTRDIKATSRQIKELADAGCEIIRLAVLNKDHGPLQLKTLSRFHPFRLLQIFTLITDWPFNV